MQILQVVALPTELLDLIRQVGGIIALVLLLALVYSMRRSQEFRRLTNRLRTLYRTAQIASSSLDTERVIAQTVGAMHEIMGYPHVAALMLKEHELIVEAYAGYQQRPRDMHITEGVVGRVARTGSAAFVSNPARDPDFVSIVPRTTSQIAYPIQVDNQTAGVLSVESVRADRLTQQDYELIGGVASELSIAFSNAIRYERTREQAIRDGLTGLYNHAYFQERLREEFARARRYQRPLSLIMADIDHFKKVNDRYGHTEGDRFLRLFAAVIREQMREVDLPARYGGEEFAVILPEATKRDAAIVAERLRFTLPSRALEVNGTELSVTASFGVAAIPDDASEPSDLIRVADEALYHAKRDGRNLVRTAGARGQETVATESPAGTPRD